MVNRRDFIKTAVTAGALGPEAVKRLAAQIIPQAAGQGPYTGLSVREWTAEKDRPLLDIALTESEAKDLITYKIKHYVLDSPVVFNKLMAPIPLNKRRDPDTINFFLSYMPFVSFRQHIWNEFKESDPWNRNHFQEKPTVEHVWRRFWERLNTREQEEDIKRQVILRKEQLDAEKKAQEEARKEREAKAKNKAYEKPTPPQKSEARIVDEHIEQVLGKETLTMLRGNVMIKSEELDHFNVKDDAAMHDATRRRPKMDFPFMMRKLGLTDQEIEAILRITPQDLEKSGINLAEKLKAQPEIKWTDSREKAALEKSPAPKWTERGDELSPPSNRGF